MAVNIDPILIQKYTAGLLNPEEMHELEKKALDDPFLADALEGYAYTSQPGKNLSILQHQLEERIARQQEEKNRFMFSWQRLSVAAVAAVIFVLAGILFWMKMTLPVKPAAKEKWVETVLTPDENAVNIEPEPAGGWHAYEQYLNANTKLPAGKHISGKVVLSFTINPDGNLSNIQIIKGLNPHYNAEAIRLLKEGPKWKAEGKPEAASLTLDFSD